MRNHPHLESSSKNQTMKSNCSKTLAALALAVGLGASSVQAAVPTKAQGLITGNAYLVITGGAVANLTASTNFPKNPDAELFPSYFEWAATGDISTAPGNWADNYGTQIVGYFYPPATGDYIFWVCSDDNGALYLSTDDSPSNKKLIAQESVWSNPREYVTSGGNSNLTMKDSSQFALTQWPTKDPVLGGAKITLQAGRAYYIEALSKEGGGGDNLSVAVQNPGATIDSTLPIPGIYLSSDRTFGAATVAAQPQSQTVDERGSVTFRLRADGTPPYSYQWRKAGAAIAGATNNTYSVASAAVADNNAKYSVVVTGAQGTATSQDAVLTVTPDKVPPTVDSVKGLPNLTEIALSFSENVESASANTAANYKLSSSSGSLNVTAVSVSASGTSVVLTTAKQTLGTKYTILISNIKDTAAVPNTIVANSKVVFFPTGKLVEVNGFIVFEAENYDRNLDDRWIRNTTRGTPSGGVSMVVPNGGGGNESGTKLEYDVNFKQAATYKIWYRASGNDGGDDSAWFHFDGERPAERVDGNSAAMTGFSGALDFIWRAESFGGVQPMSVDIATPGPHVVGLALREDGSFFDKFILTTDLAFTPTGFGSAETREGAPSSPAITLTAPTAGQSFVKGANVTLSATVIADARVDIVRVEFLANGKVIGEDTTAPYTFTWNNVSDGIYSVAARVTDELRASTTTATVGIAVVGGAVKQYQQDAAGLVVMEAENFDGLTPAPDGHTWTIGTDRAGFSGSGHVQSLPNSGANQNVNPDLLTQSPRLDYNVKFVKGGTHYIWILGGDPDAGGAGDSVNAGINGVNPPTALRIDGAPGFNIAAGWNWVGNIQGDTRATIEVPSAGSQVVNIWMREDGFYFDKLIITSDANYTPTGTGPAESVRSGGAPPPPTGPKITWVSFHESSDKPDATAAGVGLTAASDRGYTDLLTAKGYQVTRYLTTATPNAAVLNAADLVIVSRAVPSGNFQDAAATAWNTTIKAPMIVMGGYTLRNSRMGFTTGATIPDSTGDIRLKANNPSHAIFKGVSLDANNTMVNLYAGIESFLGQTPPLVQRGISVNTDPVAGNGVVLATVSTASDPTVGGVIIGEWQTGAVMGNATKNVLAGRRLVFLSGSREAANFTGGDAAGFYDLEKDGELMFLNAVTYMTAAPTTARPTVAMTRTATGISITFTGTLQSADSVTGPWTDASTATSPLAVTASQGMKFYRAK